MSELLVVATIPAKRKKVDELRVVLRALVAATREEEGCLSYDLYESASAPGTFITLERWVSQDALDAHLRTAHVGEALKASEGALRKDIEVHPLVPMS